MRMQQKHTFDQLHKAGRLGPLAPVHLVWILQKQAEGTVHAHRGSIKVIPGDKWGSQEKSPAIETTPLFLQLFTGGGYYTSAG